MSKQDIGTENNLSAMENNIIQLRDEFLKIHKDDLEDKYAQSDIDMVKETDRFLECFLMSSEGDIYTTVDNLHNTLLARKQYNMSCLKEEDLNKEVIDRKVLYWKGLDKDGTQVLYFCVSNHKKGTLMDETKQYIIYILNKHYMQNMGEEIYIIFDFTGAGFTNMDLELTKFIITALTTYFPHTTKKILLFEMPFLLYAIWKVIKSWLTAHQKARIVEVGKSDIINYIDPKELEAHMRK